MSETGKGTIRKTLLTAIVGGATSVFVGRIVDGPAPEWPSYFDQFCRMAFACLVGYVIAALLSRWFGSWPKSVAVDQEGIPRWQWNRTSISTIAGMLLMGILVLLAITYFGGPAPR